MASCNNSNNKRCAHQTLTHDVSESKQGKSPTQRQSQEILPKMNVGTMTLSQKSHIIPSSTTTTGSIIPLFEQHRVFHSAPAPFPAKTQAKASEPSKNRKSHN